MKSTGIIRKIDDLGRIVIPIELRNKLDISIREPLEIYVDKSSMLNLIASFVEIQKI